MVERGTDINELSRSRNQKTLTFEYKGQSWEVHYRDVTWEARLNAIEQGWKEKTTINENGERTSDVTFDTSQYYCDMWHQAIADINGQTVSLSLLKTFDHEVITHLLSIVPSPLLATSVAESKKAS